jgi:hypothetical protein
MIRLPVSSLCLDDPRRYLDGPGGVLARDAAVQITRL